MQKKKFTPISYDVVQIKYKTILIYTHFELNGYTPESKYQNFKGTKTYTGKVAHHVRKRISKAVDLFLQSSPTRKLYNPVTKKTHPFKLSFITLTISYTRNQVPAKEGYSLLLKPFLTWLRDTKKIKSYIWKAELQERKQLHYHITLNEFLHYNEIKEKWNYLQQKANLLEDYFNEHNHYNPNSTDVHSVYKIKDIGAYLAKYLSKAPGDDDKINGKTWDCSDNLKGKKFLSFNSYDIELPNQQELIKKYNLRMFKNDFCTIYTGKANWALNLLNEQQKEAHKQFINSITNPASK